MQHIIYGCRLLAFQLLRVNQVALFLCEANIVQVLSESLGGARGLQVTIFGCIVIISAFLTCVVSSPGCLIPLTKLGPEGRRLVDVWERDVVETIFVIVLLL